jgi:hypothetical protein
MAIPLLAVVIVALAPIMLPVLGPWFLVGHFVSCVWRFPAWGKFGDFFLFPVITMAEMMKWTLIGKGDEQHCFINNDSVKEHSDSLRNFKASLISWIAVTALAVVAAVVTVALFFATALIPLVVLWPVVAVCGCAAILGVVVFWNFLCMWALSDKLGLRQKIYAVDHGSNIRFNDIEKTLDSWLKYGADTDSVVWERILDVLEMLSAKGFAHAVIGPAFPETSLFLNLFTHCKEEDTLIRSLELCNWKFFSDAKRTPFFQKRLVKLCEKIRIRAERNRTIRMRFELSNFQAGRNKLLWEKVYAVDPNSTAKFSRIEEALDSWLQYKEGTDSVVWERILDVLEVLSAEEFDHAVFGPGSAKGSLFLNLFMHCGEEGTLVRALKRLKTASYSVENISSSHAIGLCMLREKIAARASESSAIQAELDGLDVYLCSS